MATNLQGSPPVAPPEGGGALLRRARIPAPRRLAKRLDLRSQPRPLRRRRLLYGADRGRDAALRLQPPLRVVCATHDELHNAYLWAGGRRADPTFRLTFCCANHGLLCVSIARLKLWEDAENWHGEAVPSSKL